MIRQVPIQIIAACFAMCGFALAVLTGLVSSVEPSAAMERALLAMLACWFIGAAVARSAAVAVREHAAEYHAERHEAAGIEMGEMADTPSSPRAPEGMS